MLSDRIKSALAKAVRVASSYFMRRVPHEAPYWLSKSEKCLIDETATRR